MDLPQTQCAKSARDQSLATALYQRHAQAVFLYLRRHLLSREDAEDLLLEVFLSAVEKQTPLEFSEQRQRAWLLRVARYKLIDYHRQNTRRPRVSLDEQFTDTLLADEEKAGTSSVPVTGSFEITYNQPAAGKVELYWKGQLAKTLVFTVNPKA